MSTRRKYLAELKIVRTLRRRVAARPKSRILRKSLNRHVAEALRLKRKLREPKRLKAYRVAASLVGVMEQGGNNQGATVMKIIRANGGTGPEPWCGDFVAYCYQLAGSKAVQRAWAAVRMIRGLAGVRATSRPRRGDLVRFTFDHVGMFSKDLGNGYIETIEGNTGASGAVSDSRTGGDGVYRKARHKSYVRDYLRVTR